MSTALWDDVCDMVPPVRWTYGDVTYATVTAVPCNGRVAEGIPAVAQVIAGSGGSRLARSERVATAPRGGCAQHLVRR